MVSRTNVNARLRTVTITKDCITPKTERGLPVRKRPRNNSTKAAKIEGVKRYCKMNETSKESLWRYQSQLIGSELKENVASRAK